MRGRLDERPGGGNTLSGFLYAIRILYISYMHPKYFVVSVAYSELYTSDIHPADSPVGLYRRWLKRYIRAILRDLPCPM